MSVDWTTLKRLIQVTRDEVKERDVQEVLLKQLTKLHVKRVAVIGERKNFEKMPMNVDEIRYFNEMDNLEYDAVGEDLQRRFDLVVSFYTTNQYFQTEQTAKQFINNVSAMLKRGGRFLCLYHNALAITDLLSTRPLGLYETRAFTLEKQWQQRSESFGSRYAINDERNKYQGYLMFNNVLVTLAKRHRLQPQVVTNDEILEYLVKQPNYDIYHMIDSAKLKNVALFVKADK